MFPWEATPLPDAELLLGLPELELELDPVAEVEPPFPLDTAVQTPRPVVATPLRRVVVRAPVEPVEPVVTVGGTNAVHIGLPRTDASKLERADS
jgi:hypothetical protein